MLRYLPLIVVSVVAIPLTAYQWVLMDWVWGNNTPALQCAYLLQQGIPKEFGDWVGEDQPVSEKILQVAGADGYINRYYTNRKTGEQVGVWLIVGHFRQIWRHTPNYCYKTAGYEQTEPTSQYQFTIPHLATSTFKTAKFTREQEAGVERQRVFWSWWKPEPIAEGTSDDRLPPVAWAAPEDPRVQFGYCRALYKLYFTAAANEKELPTESVCNAFAQEFLPIVNETVRQSGLRIVQEELPPDCDAVLSLMRENVQKPAKVSGEATL